jgi:glycosyltransferase involved in cell wall biosynthesis
VPRLLFFITEDWYFRSHRLALARAARDAGFEVHLATRVSQHGDEIRAEGFHLHPLRLARGGIGPLAELRSLVELWRLLRRLRPDLLHNVALKPVLYGSLAGRLAGVPAIVNAVTGMGFLFSSDQALARRLRPALWLGLRLLLRRRGVHVIVQNRDDQALIGRLTRAERIHLIRGSGVDIEHYQPLPEPAGAPTVALVARMLEDKGIRELVDAGALLRQRDRAVRVLLAGPLDPENRAGLAGELVRGWQQAGLVEWLGPVADVRTVWAQAHLAVLPSYREGLPKSLLEAAACGRAMIAADVPGCREIVIAGRTGRLVPARSVEPLADAIAELLDDAATRQRMARAARALAVEELSQEAVNRDTLALYRCLLPEPRA